MAGLQQKDHAEETLASMKRLWGKVSWDNYEALKANIERPAGLIEWWRTIFNLIDLEIGILPENVKTEFSRKILVGDRYVNIEFRYELPLRLGQQKEDIASRNACLDVRNNRLPLRFSLPAQDTTLACMEASRG